MMTVQYQGLVDHQDEPGIDPFTRLGDILTVTFSFDPATQFRDEFDPSYFVFRGGDTSGSLTITTSSGLSWTAADEVNDLGVLLRLDDSGPVMRGAHYNRPNSATVPDLVIRDDYRFRIQGGDYLYGNTTASLGFSGKLTFVNPAPVKTSFAPVTAIAEPEDWALMIVGFLFIGTAIRWRRSPQLTFV